jgi:very-short-patch-repair endonuclease
MSPIEDALLDALAPVLGANGITLLLCAEHADREGLAICHCKVWAPPVYKRGDPAVLVCRQATEGGYRVDMLLRLGNVSRSVHDAGVFDAVIAVECDGHDFHERTKQQAAYDRARDRELLIRRGLVTVRFTGSEIHRDANQCARECLDALVSIGALGGQVG